MLRCAWVVALRSGFAAFILPVCGEIRTLAISMWSLVKEFFQFARQEKKWWLIPLVIILLGLSAVLIFGSSSGIAWLIYPFM